MQGGRVNNQSRPCIKSAQTGTLSDMTGYEERPSEGLNAAVAAELAYERVASGLTFEGLAERTGISTRQLKRLLTERDRHLQVSVIAKLAAVYGMSVSDVFARAEERMARFAPLADPVASKTFAEEFAQRREDPSPGEGSGPQHSAREA